MGLLMCDKYLNGVFQYKRDSPAKDSYYKGLILLLAFERYGSPFIYFNIIIFGTFLV